MQLRHNDRVSQRENEAPVANNERLLELFKDLVDNYLKEFIRKNKVTPTEYRQAVKFLEKTGSSGEIPLMMDVFLETAVDEVAYGQWAASPTAIEGPFYIEGAPILETPYELPHRDEEPGDVMFFCGQVCDQEGNPLKDVELDMWQCDANGLYSNIFPSVPEFNLRGRFYTDEEGRFEVRTIVPVAYEIPKEGPTGQLLRAIGSHTWRPAHIHVKLRHENFHPLTTQIYFEGGEWVNDDCVGGVKPDLVARLEKHDTPSDYRQRGLDEPYYTVNYDFVLVPAREEEVVH
jgi:catechol 1,2-dioxygenase